MYKRYVVCVGLCVLFPTLAFANVTDPAKLLSPAEILKKDFPDFKVSGYVDGSYNYLQRSKRFASGSPDRVFDLQENGFVLQQAAVTLANQPKQGWGGLLNLTLGRDAFSMASYGWNPNFGSQIIGFDLSQAFLQYAAGAWTTIAGKFNSLAGYEQTDPTQDTNFSRSILSGFANPSTHLGVRETYAVNDKVNLIAGLNNGWDNIRDTSRQKTVELGVSYTPNPRFSFALADYYGQERATNQVNSGPVGQRNLVDVIGIYNATDKLTFVVNYDYGTQSKAVLPSDSDDDVVYGQAVWQGLEGNVNYKFNDKWRVSFRGEIFEDKDGFRTGQRQNWRELTLTLGYIPITNVELRLETRRDFSNVDAFVNKNGETVANNQQSYGFEALYKFG